MSDRNAKREQFETPKKGRSKLLLPLAVIALVLTAVVAGVVFSQSPGGHQAISAGADGNVRLAVNDFADGQARFFRFQSERGPVDFFVVKSRDGVIRAAFDSCDVCYRERKGYRQEGNEMVCINCDQRFPTERINEIKGGCNPAPLRRHQAGDQLIIAASDIARGAGYFASHVN